MNTETRRKFQCDTVCAAGPGETARQMGYVCLILVFALVAAGCKPKEKASIAGQIFIVTKEHANIVLGGEKVALLDASAALAYFNSSAVEWSNELAVAQAKVDQAVSHYNALYRDELAQLSTVENDHQKTMTTAVPNTPAWNQAYDGWKKTEDKIRGLHKFKKSSPEKAQIDELIRTQALLWDQIDWPSAGDLHSNIDITTTDSEGRFKFAVPKQFADADLLLLVKSEQPAEGGKEKYWWMANVSLNGKKTAEFILSNDNRNDLGVWGVITDKAVSDYMVNYHVKMKADKSERDYQDQLESAQDGKDDGH